MHTSYSQAVLELVRSGTSFDAALVSLRQLLEKKGHSKLLGAILRDMLVQVQTKNTALLATVTVARAGDEVTLQSQIAAALATLVVPSDTKPVTVVDPTIIGGFSVTYDHAEYDQTYKRVLKSLYESITK